ncbi:MAG: hypothetical protein RBU37_15925 [Myxococcota bacterium]|nr:hypothetical protein [Myxococcota bacterium]
MAHFVPFVVQRLTLHGLRRSRHAGTLPSPSSLLHPLPFFVPFVRFVVQRLTLQGLRRSRHAATLPSPSSLLHPLPFFVPFVLFVVHSPHGHGK